MHALFFFHDEGWFKRLPAFLGRVWGGIDSQVYKLHTFEEFIVYNFALRDAFLHIGKFDALCLGALPVSSSAVGDCSIASALLLTLDVYRLHI